MAFLKTGIAANAQVVRNVQPSLLAMQARREETEGMEKAGLVWDGEHWIPKAEWEARTGNAPAKKD